MTGSAFKQLSWRYFVCFAGIGKMIIMMEYLQKECDRQARKVIAKFKENREFEKKVRFRFLTRLYFTLVYCGIDFLFA